MIDKVSVLIAGDSHIEESLRSKRPDVKVVGVLHDLSLVEYVSAEVPVDEPYYRSQDLSQGRVAGPVDF